MIQFASGGNGALQWQFKDIIQQQISMSLVFSFKAQFYKGEQVRNHTFYVHFLCSVFSSNIFVI